MSELKYCCKMFESYYATETNFIRVPNIKIIKLKTEHSTIDSKEYKRGICRNLRFCITTRDSVKWDITKVIPIFIVYCPFCGKNLYKFYKNDAYANEIEGETF